MTGDPQTKTFLLRIQGFPYRNFVAPTVTHFHHHVVTGDFLCTLCQRHQRIDIITDEADLDSSIRHGRQCEQSGTRQDVRIVGNHIFIELTFLALCIFRILRFNQDIGKVRLRTDGRTCQIITHRRASQRKRIRLDFLVTLEILFYFDHILFDIIDTVTFRENQVGTEIGLVHDREETLRHDAHNKQRQEQGCHHRSKREITTLDQAPQYLFKLMIQFCVIRIFGFARFRLFQYEIAESRRLRQSQYPTQSEGYGKHDKQRLDDLGHRSRSQVHRQERTNSDKSRTQQRPLRFGGPVDQRLIA